VRLGISPSKKSGESDAPSISLHKSYIPIPITWRRIACAIHLQFQQEVAAFNVLTVLEIPIQTRKYIHLSCLTTLPHSLFFERELGRIDNAFFLALQPPNPLKGELLYF
jgi:hypothetical protein